MIYAFQIGDHSQFNIAFASQLESIVVDGRIGIGFVFIQNVNRPNQTMGLCIILRFFHPAACFQFRQVTGGTLFILFLGTFFQLLEHSFNIPFFCIIVFDIAGIGKGQVYHPISITVLVFRLGENQAVAVGICGVACFPHHGVGAIFFHKDHFCRQFQFGLIAQINGCRALDDLVVNIVCGRIRSLLRFLLRCLNGRSSVSLGRRRR